MKSETEVDVTFAESEHPRRLWLTPSLARLDLANARGSHLQGHVADNCSEVG
jgi:hypothetical protein